MPIHDWSKVDAGLFHHFHQGWTIEISDALNAGELPAGNFALAEQIVSGPIPDVVRLQQSSRPGNTPGDAGGPGGVAIAEAPPRATHITTASVDPYVRKANRIVIRHRHGEVVAVIEILSPGNKSSVHALATFASKATALLRQGIHLLIVDLFPPSPRDPCEIHRVLWDEIGDESYTPPPDKPLTAAAYSAADPITAYVEPLAVGDELPALPLFLRSEMYIPAPLEATYQTTWSKLPGFVRELVATVSE